MCKQFILASVGAIAIAGSAFAAEPAPVPPPPVPVFTWSGVYLGGQIGYAWGKDNVSWSGTDANTLNVVGGSFGEGPQGVIGGAHLGYNIQPNSVVCGRHRRVRGRHELAQNCCRCPWPTLQETRLEA